MVYLQPVSIGEEPPTADTCSLLSLEQVSHLRRSVGVGALSPRPIEPIAVKWAFGALHLDMPSDWHGAVAHQAPFFGGKVPFTLLGVPVGVGSPRPRFVGMASFGPLPQPPKHIGVHRRVAAFGAHMGVVPRSSSDEGIQMSNERRLRCCLMSEDDRFEGLLMAFEGGRARLDDGFEPESRSIASFSCVCLAHRVLANMVG